MGKSEVGEHSPTLDHLIKEISMPLTISKGINSKETKHQTCNVQHPMIDASLNEIHGVGVGTQKFEQSKMLDIIDEGFRFQTPHK